jgi:predicted  nucleic acid-binding Zn-ribbon protein
MLVEKVRKLLALIEERAVLDKKKSNINVEIDLHEKNMGVIEAQHNHLKKEVRECQKAVALFELEIKTFATSEVNLKQKLQGLIRQKDVDAVRREILAVQNNREQIESRLLEELDQLETLQKMIITEEPLLLEQKRELESKIKILKGFVAEVDQTLSPLLKALDEASISLPDNMQSQYKRISVRLDRPIVPLVGNHCVACYSFISAQQLLELKKKQIGDCKNCGRIIFMNR